MVNGKWDRKNDWGTKAKEGGVKRELRKERVKRERREELRKGYSEKSI